MPSLTFLGIENPLGVLGVKVKGIVSEAEDLKPVEKVSKITRDARQYAVTRPDARYKTRANNLEESISKLMVDDTITNRDYILKLLKAKQYPDLRLIMSSSLNSMLKYLAQDPGLIAPALGGAAPDNVDTVIIFGHGMPGSINMGLGKIGIGPALPHHHPKYADRKHGRETFGLDKKSEGELPEVRRIRDLNLDNVATWTGSFQSIAQLADVRETGYFHLFLMGCSVGASKQVGDQRVHLQQAAANALANQMKNDVCVSAPVDAVDEDHLDDLLARLPEVCEGCVNGKAILKGKSDDAVKLKSFTASP